MSIFKVIDACVTSRSSMSFFELTLDCGIKTRCIVPTFSSVQKKHELYQFYQNNRTLDPIVGKLVTLCGLELNKYGYQFKDIYCFDVLSRWIDVLEKNKDTYCFSSEYAEYFFNLLVKRGRQVAPDNSIKLQGNYSDFRIRNLNGRYVCYKPLDSNRYVTLDNIRRIYYGVFLPQNESSDLNDTYIRHKISLSSCRITQERTSGRISYTMRKDNITKEYKTLVKYGDLISEDIKQIIDSMPYDELYDGKWSWCF